MVSLEVLLHSEMGRCTCPMVCDIALASMAAEVKADSVCEELAVYRGSRSNSWASMLGVAKSKTIAD